MCRSLHAFLLLSISLVVAPSPEHAVTSLGRDIQTNIFFFPNSTCFYESAVRYSHEERNLYVSHDRGRSWKREMSMPGNLVEDVILHPFDGKMAFVMTVPRDPTVAQTHYRTEDSGRTWTPFQLPPSPMRGTSLSFHSDPNKSGHILYLCEACDSPDRHRICTAKWRQPDLGTARLYSSTDFFDTEKNVEELCAGKGAKGFITANPLPFNIAGETMFCVTKDMKTWTKAEIPLRFRRNQYSLLPAGHALGIDVYTSPGDSLGTLLVSDESGKWFVESLKDTNWAKARWLDPEVVGRKAERQLRTLITYDDGRSWAPVAAGGLCGPSAAETCSLHLYPRSVSRMYSKTSSASPGVIVGVGSAGPVHVPYKESDTFLSTDGGSTWAKLSEGAFIYEFGDAGSILVMINAEHPVSKLQYSMDLGTDLVRRGPSEFYDFGVTVTPLDLIPVPEAGGWKFILYAERSPIMWADRYVMRGSQCTEDDFETWYMKSPGSDTCFMGSKQPFKRRKPHRDCYVGDTATGPLASEGSCPCSDADYECDHNFGWDDAACVAIVPEAFPPGMCTSVDDVYMGSSGYRKVPGNACVGGSKDAPVQKSSSLIIVIPQFEFPSKIVQHQYLKNSTTILVLLVDHTLWQSANEGYSWTQLYPEEHFTQFYIHKFDSSRAYLLTKTEKFYFTVDGGRTWDTRTAPSPPTSFHVLVLRFQPEPDTLLWLGDRDCKDFRDISRDNGRTWTFVEKYVVNCAWAVGTKLVADEREILCESYSNKTGSQMLFQMRTNPLALVEGPEYFRTQKKIFDHVVGFTKFSEFLVVAEIVVDTGSLNLQISLDGVHFAAGQFPPNMKPETHAYTILDSSTASLFVHMTMAEPSDPRSQSYWGNILKSNSNGTYFGLSAENVNRDRRGYVDFEKVVGLDGIALINVVSNPEEALLTGHKVLQSRITHNDGSTWKPLAPPTHDSLGNAYPCDTTHCTLHVHGYTERLDSSTTYSSSSVVGLIMAVGNVGESLAPYDQSDTFLSRDGGRHLWKVGDSGSVIVIANDEEPTDHVLFSLNEGMSWRQHKFSDDKIRVRSIMTVPADTSRRFLVLGHPSRSSAHLAVFIDFTALTSRQCTVNHRRVRETDCFVGIQPKANERIERACACVKADFECEFNYYKNAEDDCVLAPGTSPLPNENTCQDDAEYWYERTAYRKIAFSSCKDGERLDQGLRHPCIRSNNGHGWFFWFVVLMAPLVLVALAGYWYSRNPASVSSAIFYG
ncbi:hypothetical protein B0H14DRAFT_3095034 [Mycena olivaceomarginata]|nr:hypothetical protein B0H14DRAFT_3095034 [Mycena olivaceomarginata]